jgi:hypothetical protein
MISFREFLLESEDEIYLAFKGAKFPLPKTKSDFQASDRSLDIDYYGVDNVDQIYKKLIKLGFKQTSTSETRHTEETTLKHPELDKEVMIKYFDGGDGGYKNQSTSLKYDGAAKGFISVLPLAEPSTGTKKSVKLVFSAPNTKTYLSNLKELSIARAKIDSGGKLSRKHSFHFGKYTEDEWIRQFGIGASGAAATIINSTYPDMKVKSEDILKKFPKLGSDMMKNMDKFSNAPEAKKVVEKIIDDYLK